MTTNEAKAIIAYQLTAKNLLHTRLTARRVGLSDLARDSTIVVTIYGWKPSPEARNLKAIAYENGFLVEFA